MTMQLTSTKEYSKHRKQLALVASPAYAGRRRAAVEEAFSQILGEPAFCLHYNKSWSVVTGIGAPFEPKLKDDSVRIGSDEIEISVGYDQSKVFQRGYLHPKLETSHVGAAFSNKTVAGWTVPCGVVLILAGGGMGKTPLAHALAGAVAAHSERNDRQYAVVRIGEPLSGYSSGDVEAARDLSQAIVASSDVVLDSIKDLLSSAEGAAMKTGLSRGALTSISGWASLACDLGCTIYVPVNPSSDDPQVMELLYEVGKSNATAVLMKVSDNVWEYSSRRGEGLSRARGNVQITYDNDEVRIHNATNYVATEESNEEFAVRFKATVEDFSAATARTIAQRTSKL